MNDVDPNSVVIESLQPQHINAVVDIEIRSFDHPWSKDSFLQLLDQKHFYGFGLFQSNTLIGYCFLYFVMDEINIVNIAMDPSKRQKGLASKMLVHIHQWGKAKGAKRSFLEVSVENQAAIKLYESFGYNKQGRRVKFYAGNQDAHIMTKPL